MVKILYFQNAALCNRALGEPFSRNSEFEICAACTHESVPFNP